jgi:hypothetical protein
MRIKTLGMIVTSAMLYVSGAFAASGTATILPGTVAGGAIVTSTVTFKVPAGGLSANTSAYIAVDLPANWNSYLQTNCPSCNGYVTVTTTGPVTFAALKISTSGVVASLQSGTFAPGTSVIFGFVNIYSGCPFSGQTLAVWPVRSGLGGNAATEIVSNPPTQSYVAGPGQWLGFINNSLTTVANQPSPALILRPYNNCGQIAPLSSSTTISLFGLAQNSVNYSYATDSGAVFSNTVSFSSPITSIALPALATAATFYYQTSTTGNLAIQCNYPSIAFTGGTQQAWLYVTALTAAPSFTKLSIDNGTVVTGQTQTTITPDGTGANSAATIRFLPSTNTQQWHVTISSNGFATTVYERWGSGDPQSAVVWNGQLASSVAGGTSQVAPNGTYTVKVEYVGLGTNTSMSVIVNTSQISGTVTVGGSPIAGAIISAQGSGIYNSVTSDASGNYTINGLHAGNSYNLYATYTSSTNLSVVTGQLTNVTAPATGKNFVLATPAVIRVASVVANAATSTVYGNLNLHSADYSQNFFGNLRLQSGTTTSDNGDAFSSSSWTVFYVQPNVPYTIHLTMPGYGASDVTVTNSSNVVLALSQKANVYGVITLPSPAAYSIWASVSGTPVGGNSPTVWGGASFNVGQSTAIYSVFAVPAGTYSFAAQLSGFAPSVLSSVVVGASDLGSSVSGGVNFPTLSVGGTISGTVTIAGDTSNLTSAPNLYLNAYSPSLGYNVSTKIQLTTSTTQSSASYQIGGVADGSYQMYSPYLQGFDPSSFGPRTVTVSGSAVVNFTLTQVTGQITGTVSLPAGHSDYANVHVSVQGPSTTVEQNLTSSGLTLQHLGTGFYNVRAIYKTTGAQTNTTVSLTNGQAASVVLDLSAATYAVSGVVGIQSPFSIKTSTGTQVTINTLSDLLANATNQNLYLGGSGVNGFSDCSSVAPLTTSTVRVEAFPKSFSSYSDSNRNGLSNCFMLGGYYFGTINADGTYSIPGLYPGVWEIDVYPYFDNGQTPNAAAKTQFITVTNGNISGLNFSLSAGNSVSGTVNLPSGLTDNRQFNVQILDTRGNTIQSASLQLGAAGGLAASANYTFSNLPSGQYSLMIQDPGSYDTTLSQNVIKYVSAPVQFDINGADVTTLNVTMVRAARIVGSLGIQTTTASGSNALTLITSNNISLLPSRFQISAQADPWIAGGYQGARDSFDGTNKPAIDANNQFTIDGLAAGTYNVYFQQNSYGGSVQAAGGVNLASYIKGSVVVTQGQTLDLGVITLKPGLSLSGTVKDTSGQALSNIRVRARPSNSKHGDNSLEVTSDAQGSFTFLGLTPDNKIYDIIAAPHPGLNDTTPSVPYGQVIHSALDVTQVPAPTLNFVLSPATSRFTGSIRTADGGPLAFPDNDQSGYPEAAIYLHLVGNSSDDNPLGQENATNIDGSFSIGNIVAGTYDITVESLGYQPYRVTGVAIAKGTTKDLGSITLQKGAVLNATLARPDGTLVNTNEVETVVAVSQDLTSIIFGQANKDANSGNILSLKFSGFLNSPQSYNVLLFDKNNNITSPLEGRNLVFTSTSQVVTKALTYVPSPPFAFTDVKRTGAAGSSVSINYYFSRPLRNRGDDQDPSVWFGLSSAHGNLSGYSISGDRTKMTVFYTPSAGEQNATVVFSAHTVDIDPSTGVEFVLSKSITLLLGQKATVESKINPALGGTLSLAQAQDPSSVYIPANALLTGTGAAIDATVSYNFTLTSTDDIGSLTSGTSLSSQARSATLATLMSYGEHAYVSEAYQAMGAAKASASSINPLSSFYSVLLPAGVSHTLNQTAYLTLNYSSSSDPNLINVYYYNGTQYFLQNTERVIDTVNRTITVGVNHFSTFVVLQNSSPVIVTPGATDTGADITVFNFPNPFDLQSKTLTLNHPGAVGSITTGGTVIRYFVPGSKVGAATLRIYDVTGHKVRTIDLGSPAADTYGYLAWDGTNDSGKRVSSGVYIGTLDVGGAKKFWKMAVIK